MSVNSTLIGVSFIFKPEKFQILLEYSAFGLGNLDTCSEIATLIERRFLLRQPNPKGEGKFHPLSQI